MSAFDIACCNCRRKSSDLRVRQYNRYLLAGKHNRAFYAVPPLSKQQKRLRRMEGEDAVKEWLCSCCSRYLLEGSNDASDYWPGMIFKFLIHENSRHVVHVSFYDKWKLIPATWRSWWEEEFQGFGLDDPDLAPLFVDLTTELVEVNEAIAELKWLRLAKNMDRHFAYPEVRCPFGCSEFLHKTNSLPLKDFLWYYSNYEMKSYNAPTGKHWTDCMSPSYPSSCLILDKFLCCPAIAHTDDGPVILCCREHSERSNLAYLHVPESPTGTIYTPNANSVAPVVVRSRTNRSFKPNVFSDTFCTVRQVGGFGGIDSSYVTSSNVPRKCDALSSRRDALSIQGRPDIRVQLEDRSSDPNSCAFMSRYAIKRIIEYSEMEFPDPLLLPERKTSTYIPCETAVRLQEITYGESSRSIRVRDQDTGTYSDKLFVPPWPTHFVDVHPINDHGQRMYRVINQDFGLWQLLCITGRVAEVWEAISDSVKDNISWQGHWLKFAANVLELRGRKRNCSLFNGESDISTFFESPLEEILFSKVATSELFRNCETIGVIEGSFTGSGVIADNGLENKDIVFCIQPTLPDTLDEGLLSSYELRCLVSADVDAERSLVSRNEWRMYARHKGMHFWFQHGTRHACKYSGMSLDESAWDGARIAVFCRKEDSNPVSLKRRYLNAIGGQSSVFCAYHRCPLVLNHLPKRKGVDHVHKCACDKHECGSGIETKCCEFGTYICPNWNNGCRTAVCDKHLREAKQKCTADGPETIMFLSEEDAVFLEYRSSDDGAIRSRFPPEMEGVPPEALGPTAAHELPQDMVEVASGSEDSDSDVESVGIVEDAAADEDFEDEDSGERENRSLDETANDIFLTYETLGADNDFDSREGDDFEDGDSGERENRTLDETADDIFLTHETLGADNDFDSGEDSNFVVNGDTVIDSIDHFNTCDVPTTTTGTEQLEIAIDHCDPSGFSIPLYVLLNQQGHLLTRTNHKLRMNKMHRSICERLVAKSSSKVVPLIYAEAQLFPIIFWYSMRDGSVPGAMPTALWTDKKTLNKLGLSSMREHAKMRVTNPALQTSTNPAYHFMLLDQLTNLGANGKHTRVVLQRGFADHQRSDGVSFRDKGDSAELYGETCENHANVHKLSALVQERRPHFFFTQTCNQKTCKGLRVLREWITSAAAIHHLRDQYGLEDQTDASNYLRESAASYVSRSWNEVADMWMRYIIYSPDEPLSKIDYGWYRKEFQDTQGNLAHIHAILRTLYDVDDPEGLKAVLDKIRGCVNEIVRHPEYLEMKEKGYISSVDHLIEILEQAKSYLPHRCHLRCQIPKMTEDGEVYYVCKSPDNFFRSPTPYMHTLVPIKISHTVEATQIYNELGMMIGDIVVDESLLSEFHVPISSREDAKFSPTNGKLFVLFPSSQNLQYTTGHMIGAYLVKYVTKIDEVARVIILPPRTYDKTRARGEIEQLHNTKITSNKILADRTRKKNTNYGRLVTHTECLSVILGEELVTSTVPFVHFSTAPREYRTAFYKKGHSDIRNVPNGIHYLANVNQEIRLKKFFPPYRQFSSDQMRVIFDERSSSLSVDAITVFSVRPPELRFVDSVRLYFRWFERQTMEYEEDTLTKELNRRLKHDIMKCHWIDGLHMHVVLRRGAVEELLDFARERDFSSFGTVSQKTNMTTLLLQIQKLVRQFDHDNMAIDGMDDNDHVGRTLRNSTNQSSQSQYEMISTVFLSHGESMTLPTPWTTPVYPKNRGRFLVYILLLFGRFETEYRLMDQNSMRDAYVHAKLFDLGNPEESIKALLTRYVHECLRYQHGSVYHHDRNLVLAKAAFSECLLGDQNQLVIGTPCVLQSAMKRDTTEKVQLEKQKLLESFISALYADLQNAGLPQGCLPDKDQLTFMHCRRSSLRNDGINLDTAGNIDYIFPPVYDKNGHQSLDSYYEQRKVLESAKSTIDRFLHGLSHKNMVICGGPGNGKTTVCEEVSIYALSKGLRGISTSIVADRSKALGGMHIHLLCSIPISDRRNMSPGRAAEAALNCIYRKPELLHFWRELQFLYIDEFGAVNAEMLATMDIIARSVKDSSRFLGGMLVICSMDIRQLMPIDGTALMLSMNMMTEFNFTELKESVRAARDANLRRLCILTRSQQWDDEKRQEFRRIVTQHCKFVPSFDSNEIPEDGIFVFARKAPCRKIEDVLIQKMRNDPSVTLVVSHSEDEESSVAGDWKVASRPVSQQLSTQIKGKKDLYLYAKARYEFTYNLHGHFQQGQLAILLSIDQDDVDNRRSIQFYKGPPGCKEFPPLRNFNKQYLESHGWEPVMVPFEMSKPKRIWGRVVARRAQYGVRLRIASTIHASQGATFGKLITAVSNNNHAHGDMNFALWEAAQVVVLLSRTRFCSDLYFVGRKNEVVDHLLSVLEKSSHYIAHITSITQRLCAQENETSILPRPPIFRPCDIVLDSIPAVYLLISTRKYGYMYIGETLDVRKRLDEHNSGRGSKFTNNEHLRPWALFAYVYGFRVNDNRRNFEQRWKRLAIMRMNATTCSPLGLLRIGQEMATTRNRFRTENCQLRIQQCGSYEVRSHTKYTLMDDT